MRMLLIWSALLCFISSYLLSSDSLSLASRMLYLTCGEPFLQNPESFIANHFEFEENFALLSFFPFFRLQYHNSRFLFM